MFRFCQDRFWIRSHSLPNGSSKTAPAIGLIARRLEKPDAGRGETFVVVVEIGGLQEQEHTPAGLVADSGLLRVIGGLCKQQVRLRPVIGRDQHPAFAGIKWRILDQRETELADIKRDAGIIIRNQ